MEPSIDELESALLRLNRAVEANRSPAYCLKLWSKFVRLRDITCLICHSDIGLSAHHIFRKSFLIETRFQPGNGITLCKDCHKIPHDTFNGKADLDVPMDAQGGENIELTIEYLEALIEDASTRGIFRDDFYFLSDHALSTFKAAQSINPYLPFPGLRLEQARLIWMQTPRNTLKALLGAYGFSVPEDFIQIGTGMNIFFHP